MTPEQIAVVHWLAGDDTGMSSETLAFTFLGVECKISHPLDPSDLGRCMRLIEKVPQVGRAIKVLAKRDNKWAILYGNWHKLKTIMHNEAGIDWSKADRAPKTYAAMKELGL